MFNQHKRELSDLKAEGEVCISKFFPDIKLGAENLGRKKGGLKKECRLCMSGKKKKIYRGATYSYTKQFTYTLFPAPLPSLPPNASKVS